MSSVTQDDGADDLQPEADDEAAVSILTNGDPIRSWTRLPTAIVDEATVRFDADGIHVRAVDPANVAMVEATAHADGFDRFDVDGEVLFGMNFDQFRSAVSWARKRGDDGDPVAIDVFEDPARMRVAVTRPDQGMKRISEWFGIDPDQIRPRPDVPELDLPNRADPDPAALNDAVDAIADHHNHAYVTRDGATFVLASQAGGDTRPAEQGDREEAVFLPNTAWDVRDDGDAGACSSIFSLDYLTDIATGLDTSKADRVTVNWGDEFPTKLRFEHEEWGFEGQFLLAPRRKPGDEDE
jgi:proliferating cell nuclear antigen